MFILLYPFLYKTKRFIRKREKEIFNLNCFNKSNDKILSIQK